VKTEAEILAYVNTLFTKAMVDLTAFLLAPPDQPTITSPMVAVDTSAKSGGQTAMLCPDCGAEMALRANRTTGNKFWGCKKYPNCKGTRDENGLSRAEREEAKLKKEAGGDYEYPQTDGFSFNKKRDPVNEVAPEPVETTAPFNGWVNPFAKK